MNTDSLEFGSTLLRSSSGGFGIGSMWFELVPVWSEIGSGWASVGVEFGTSWFERGSKLVRCGSIAVSLRVEFVSNLFRVVAIPGTIRWMFNSKLIRSAWGWVRVGTSFVRLGSGGGNFGSSRRVR